MRIFVAGASGVIGRKLLPLLIEAGHEVVGMTHRQERMVEIAQHGAHAVVADVYDRNKLRTMLTHYQPDVIMHQLTALSEWNLEDNARIRIEGTRNLVDAAKETGVTRIIAQSISWAYEPGVGPATEQARLDEQASEPRKVTIDGVAALERVSAELPDCVILRYGMLYGPGTWYDHGGLMAERVKQGKVPLSNGVTSFVHVTDAARAAVAALEWPTGVVNIVDDEPAASVAWLPVYAAAIGADESISKLDVHSGQPWERGASNMKAREQRGWTPLYPTWRTGFAHSLQC